MPSAEGETELRGGISAGGGGGAEPGNRRYGSVNLGSRCQLCRLGVSFMKVEKGS